MAPLAVATLPSDRDDRIELLAPAGGDLARIGRVRNEAGEPEQSADRQVGADREKVPGQRRAKVGLQEALVGIGREPIEKPRPAEMDNREESSGGDREDGHGLGGPVNRSAPARAEQEKNRRDEGAGVRNTDPEDEVSDIHRPHYWVAQARHLQTVVNLVGP